MSDLPTTMPVGESVLCSKIRSAYRKNNKNVTSVSILADGKAQVNWFAIQVGGTDNLSPEQVAALVEAP